MGVHGGGVLVGILVLAQNLADRGLLIRLEEAAPLEVLAAPPAHAIAIWKALVEGHLPNPQGMLNTSHAAGW
jgi:hypothetical protein